MLNIVRNTSIRGNYIAARIKSENLLRGSYSHSYNMNQIPQNQMYPYPNNSNVGTVFMQPIYPQPVHNSNFMPYQYTPLNYRSWNQVPYNVNYNPGNNSYY